jgi:hypothetical protein
MKARSFRASQVSAFANSKQARTLISNMRNVIIRGNQLVSLANISSKRDMFIEGDKQDRDVISSEVDAKYAHDPPPFRTDNKQVMFINTYAIHTCCKLDGHQKESMVMRTSMTTLV